MEIIKRKNGESFKEKVYLSNGRTLVKTFRRKTDAIAWKQRLLVDLRRGIAIGIEEKRAVPSFQDLAVSWIERRVKPFKTEKTTYEYANITKKHLVPRLTNVKVNEITTLFADELVIDLKKSEVAPRRINKILGVLKQILSFAKTEKHIVHSPLQGYPQLKVPPRKETYLLAKEISQLLRVTYDDPFHSVLLVALNTGMRLGEITGLCWDRVNFETKQIEVTRTMDRKGLRETTKTNLIRYVPMNDEVETHLKELMWKQRHNKYVFVDKQLKHYNPDHISSRQLKRALIKANVRKIRFHDLRHTYASHFMMNGGNIYDLQKILGHTKIEMTMKYAHLSPTHLLGVANTVRFSHEGNKGRSPYLALEEKVNLQMVGKIGE